MELAFKISGALISLFALYKIVIEAIVAKSNRRREEYKFAKEFIADLNTEDTHPYLIESGFLALSGKPLPPLEIRYIMSLNQPMEATILRLSSQKYMNFDNENSGYVWIKRCQKKYIRSFIRRLYIIGYVVFGFIATSPMFINYTMLKEYIVAIYVVSFSIFAVYCLLNHQKLGDAEKLHKITNKA